MTCSVPGETNTTGAASFVVGLRPPDALAIGWLDTLDLLRRRLGNVVDLARSVDGTDPERPIGDLPEELRSPRSTADDSSWLRRTNMAGINVRTVGDFAGVVKYALTLPAFVGSVHLLPIWEPGAARRAWEARSGLPWMGISPAKGALQQIVRTIESGNRPPPERP